MSGFLIGGISEEEETKSDIKSVSSMASSNVFTIENESSYI
jgi:hypothetical protein